MPGKNPNFGNSPPHYNYDPEIRLLTALKHVKTAFKSKVLGFSICLYFSMFLCILVSLSLWFLGFLVPSFFSPSVSLVSLDS